jgi:hypothetical protein
VLRVLRVCKEQNNSNTEPGSLRHTYIYTYMNIYIFEAMYEYIHHFFPGKLHSGMFPETSAKTRELQRTMPRIGLPLVSTKSLHVVVANITYSIKSPRKAEHRPGLVYDLLVVSC